MEGEHNAAGSPSTRCERLERSEWRLTPEGVVARQDLNGAASGVLDFVLKRGLFDGQPRMVGGRIICREPVRGKGELVRLRRRQEKETGAATMHIGNWAEGAEAFAKAFAGLFAMTQPLLAPPADHAADRGTGRENLRSWTQEDLDKAILRYKAARAASYADLREGIKRNSPVAKKAARDVYGRNAIARQLRSDLLFLDECEVHLHPTLTKVWTLRGVRPCVPAAGQNRRLCVYGAFNYRTGQTHHMVHPGKNARQFLDFLRQLLRANRKRFLVLVFDNASYHQTAAVLDLLTEHEEHVCVVWLPVYSPELNAIEGLWGYVKRTATNNYFFGDIERLEDAIDRAFHALNRHPETALSLAYTTKNLRRTA